MRKSLTARLFILALLFPLATTGFCALTLPMLPSSQAQQVADGPVPWPPPGLTFDGPVPWPNLMNGAQQPKG